MLLSRSSAHREGICRATAIREGRCPGLLLAHASSNCFTTSNSSIDGLGLRAECATKETREGVAIDIGHGCDDAQPVVSPGLWDGARGALCPQVAHILSAFGPGPL